MKHIFFIVAALILAALTFSFQSAHAEKTATSVEFTYAGNPWGGGGYSEDSYKGGAMLLTGEVAARYDGCRITEVIIANGRFYNQDEAPVEIFFTHGLEETPFYRESGQMDLDHPLEFKSYPLSTPVEIHAGEPFFVGFVTWASRTCAPNYDVSYPVWTDGVFHTDLPGGYIGFSTTTGVPENMEWKNEGYSGGQICMRLRIEGDNLPQNVAELSYVSMPDYVDPTSETEAYVKVSNRGVNTLADVDLSYTVFGETVFTHIDLPEALEYNHDTFIHLGVKIEQEGVNVPVTFTIDKVNGSEPSTTASTAYGMTVHSILPENGYDPHMVVEEASGAMCGWCVRGLIGMDQLFKAHGDEAFIPISAHHIAHGEETSPIGYDAFWERYITSNPSCLINRNIPRYGITDPNTDNLNRIYQEVTTTRAIAEININGCEVEDGWLTVESEMSFAFPEESGSYSVGYVIAEDGVGPYPQSNAYAGVEYDMAGWESLPNIVSTYYDFLARGISDFDGTALNTGRGIESGKIYTHSDKVNLVKVRDMSRLAVVAMLINDKTGRIENAVRKPFTELEVCAVEEVSLNKAPAEYYDLSGRRLSGRPESGIYIVRVGSLTEKRVSF